MPLRQCKAAGTGTSMTDGRTPWGMEVKCAGCGSFFPMDNVRVLDHGYYCKECYPQAKRRKQAESKKEIKCPVCGRVLTPYDAQVKDSGKSYCPVCYNTKMLRDYRSSFEDKAKSMAPSTCAICGKTVEMDARVVDGGKSYCYVCYNIKIIGERGTDNSESIKSFAQSKCAGCGTSLDLFDLDQRKIHDGKRYCEDCYKRIAFLGSKLAEEPVFHVAEKAGFNAVRKGVTTVKDADGLFNCHHCGMVITPDRISEDEKGKIHCPKCGNELKPRETRAKRAKNEDYTPAAQLFKCLGDPCRVKIIELLSEQEICVFEFVEMTGYQYSAISYHLKMLKELGLIKSYERGNFMVYSLTDKGQIIHQFIRQSRELGVPAAVKKN